MSQTLADPKLESSQQDQLAALPGRPANRLVTRGLTVVAIIALAGCRSCSRRKASGASGVSFRVRSVGAEQNAGHRLSRHRADGHLRRRATGLVSPRGRSIASLGQMGSWRRPSMVSVPSRRYRSGPRCRDPIPIFVSRPIDYPVDRNGRRRVWQRFRPTRRSWAILWKASECVYPVLVLGKVQVVNDMVEDHPFLVVDQFVRSVRTRLIRSLTRT